MTVKLSEIFIPLPDKVTYSTEELSALNLQPDFIKKMAAESDLIYVENTTAEGNLCFVENKEVRPEYRTTFSKVKVLEIVLPQVLNPVVNLEKAEVIFPKNVHNALSKKIRE